MSAIFSITKHRIDALNDGVFAIAMTILVLEVKVPDIADRTSVSALLHAIMHHMDVIIAYFLSFTMLGLFWVWHHRLSSKVREINFAILIWSFVFLSLVCFFPFAAAVFGRYVLAGNVGGLLVYLPTVFLILLSQTMYFRTAMKNGLLHAEVSEKEQRSAHRHNMLWTGLFTLSCVPAALAAGLTAAITVAVVAIGFLWRSFAWR
jgi:uncharacterized membrane protein